MIRQFSIATYLWSILLEQQLNCYEFLGRILGKALYEGVLVDFAFAGFFLSKWLNRSSYCKYEMLRELRKLGVSYSCIPYSSRRLSFLL